MKKTIKIAFLITLIVLTHLNVNPAFTPSNASTKQNNSLGLIARISNITIGYLYTSQINLSLQYDIVNENHVDVQYPSTDGCGFTLSVTLGSLELSNGINFIENNCPTPPNTITYKPGLTVQKVHDAAIHLQNWPPNGLNDLPLGSYYLNIDHSNLLNMTTWGATLDYNGTGQFFINYDSNPFNFWGSNTVNNMTYVPNSFTRTTFVQASGTATSSASSDNLGSFIIFGAIIAVLGLVIGYGYVNRKKKQPLDKIKKVTTDSGTFQKVVLEKTCPVCGNKLLETDIFCANCGNRA